MGVPTDLRLLAFAVMAMSAAVSAAQAQSPIVHDAEHGILEAQHRERWVDEDKKLDAKLAAIRDKNAGKPPNILYILIDDMGFGDLGSVELNQVRGYRTPNINKLARECVSFARMYTEPSCTPTRTAFLTGRIPIRSHMLEPKIVPPEGTGLHKDEVTIAELLSKAGYSTVHIGKWHQGDIEQAYPHNQGFDVAKFPMHNQATFNLMTRDAEREAWANNVAVRDVSPNYILDDHFRPNGWVLGVEAERGGKAKEWGIKPGKDLGYEYYRKLNEHYVDQVMQQLRRLAKQGKPFFLNYWPQRPIDVGRVGREFRTPNGGTWVDSMAEEDEAIGKILQEVERLGLADNTIVMLMGDNGPMRQVLGRSGFSDMIYGGFKGESSEGGIRVNAFLRWPQVVAAGSVVGDMIHVTDLYTTLARIALASKYIPRDRVVDGVDQTALWLLGDTHGRRDYVHVYEGPNLRATVKQQYKVHWPAPGEPGFKLPVFDLYRDPREERPLSTEGMWSVAYFQEMRARHMALKQKYPDRPETRGKPYEGIESLRPETRKLLDNYYVARRLLNPQ